MSKLIPFNNQKNNPTPLESLIKPSFETFEGVVQDGDIEQKLLDNGLTPIEKILTKDENDKLICSYIKARDNIGRFVYVELDCDYRNGMGFVNISSNNPILSKSKNASVVPYSLKLGVYEATKGDISGIAFECNNSVCVISRKNTSLEPYETVFSHNNVKGISSQNPVPFPIIKITDLLINAERVHKSIEKAHNRMRNVAFNYYTKERSELVENIKKLNKEVERFEKSSEEYSKQLSSTINELENMNAIYEKQKTKNYENIKSIKYNLSKRHDLYLDYITLCSAMKERSDKIAALSDEIKILNDFSENLFAGLGYVFTE